MSDAPAWPSLTSGDLDELWARVRDRLERRGLDDRGRLRLPDLAPVGRRNLTAVVGAAVSATVDLGALESGLRDLGVGDDLVTQLAALGYEVSDEPARRREAGRAARAARQAARTEAATWPEAWAPAWIDEVVRSGTLRGLDPDRAVALVRDVRAVLDAVTALDPDGPPPGRVDLAATVLGSAHALDTGTRVEAAAIRALVRLVGAGRTPAVWERAGVHLDLTSGPVLTWALPVDPASGLAGLVDAATAAGVPVHLTRFALRAHPVVVAPGTDVLVVENPRLVEVAAQRGLATPVVAANGNPSGAVRLLVRQLVAGGATVRYHGDFDAAGLAIAARMAALGAVPWRMTVADYLDALDHAAADGVDLPVDPTPVGPTPWDPELATTFARHRRVVHEERLVDRLLPG